MDRDLTGYEVWRFHWSDFDVHDAWTHLADLTATENSYLDSGWAGLEEGSYGYAVRAVYNDSSYSLAVTTPELNRYTYNQTQFIVHDILDVPIPGATLSLAEANPTGHGPYNGITDGTGQIGISGIWYGLYNYTVTAAGYQILTGQYYAEENQQSTHQVNLGVDTTDPTQVHLVTGIQSAYPNLFRDKLAIVFDVKAGEEIRIDIYNQVGQHVRSLWQGYRTPASYYLEWDGRDKNGNPVSTGLYFCRMSSGTNQSIKKILRMK